jgi:hypothetical protein
MKTYPIIFSGPMIRALLQGRKTQTRRLAKRHPTMKNVLAGTWGKQVPGNLLWVRESLKLVNVIETHDQREQSPAEIAAYYAATGGQCFMWNGKSENCYKL